MIASREFAEFNALLARAAERGVPLEGAVGLLAAQARPGPLRAALEEAARALREGAPLADALGRSPGVFPEDYLAMVRTGRGGKELAGLLRAAEAYVRIQARARSVLGRFALYLAVLAGFAGVLFLGLVLVGRQFLEVYDSLKVPMPPLTNAVAWASKHPVGMAVALAALAASAWGAFRLARRSEWVSTLLYYVPGWGPVWKARDLARFSAVLAIRLHAGMAVPAALEETARAMPTAHARAAVTRVRDRVEGGEGLSSALFYVPFFPRTLAWAVSLAEERADLPGTLEAFSRLYLADLERSFEAFFALLTPIGIVLLGNVAGFFAGAIFLPLIALLDGIGGGFGRGSPPVGLRFLVSWAVLNGTFAAAILAAYLFVGRRRARVQLFVDHLAALAARSMPLHAGIRMLGRDLGEVFGLRLDRVARRIEDGRSLGEALAEVPEAVPPFPRAMIALGERSGNLAAFLEEARRSYRRLLEGSPGTTYFLLYPLFLSLILNLALAAITVFVKPKMDEVVVHVGADPGPLWVWPAVAVGNQAMILLTIGTALFVFAGGASTHHGLWLLTLVRGWFDPVVVRIPILGRIVRQGAVSRFALATGLFARAGSGLPEALAAAAEAEPNRVLRRGFRDVAREVSEGRGLAEACRRSGAFPGDFVWFAETGESAAALPDALLGAASHFDTRSRFLARVAARSLLPAFSVLNGALVLGAAAMMLLPLRNVMKGVSPW